MSQKEKPIIKKNWFYVQIDGWNKWNKDWGKKHPKATRSLTWFFIVAISIVLSLTFFLFSIPFGVFIILSPDAVKTLIETEATVLGFFGLIAVYLLTSYDNRIDKLEEKRLDIRDAYADKRYRPLQEKIMNQKRRASIAIISALISIIFSIFLSIVTLGLISTNNGNPTQIAYQIAIPSVIVSSTLLFIGVFSIFLMIYRTGREPDIKSS